MGEAVVLTGPATYSVWEVDREVRLLPADRAVIVADPDGHIFSFFNGIKCLGVFKTAQLRENPKCLS